MPKAIRQIRVEGNIAYVPLTRGYEAIIDAEDVPLVEGFNWWASPGKNTFYAARSGKTQPDGSRPYIAMHRQIMREPPMFVDHRDGNGLNNRQVNLRVATNGQNKQNSAINRNNTSGFKGVHLRSDFSKWVARIEANGKRVTIGSYATPEEAAAAYADASVRLHGDFGRIR